MTIAIEDIRVSMIWTDAFGFLLDDDPEVIPVPDRRFLGHAGSYVARFDEEARLVRKKPYRRSVPADELHLPWESPWGQRFWTRYLGGTALGHVTGVDAWNRLVPFRERIGIPLRAGWLARSGSVSHEVFFFPHGVTFVLTARYQPSSPASLEDAVRAALRVQGDRAFTVIGDSEEPMPSGRLAEAMIRRARESLFGDDAPVPTDVREPFTVFTVVKASGVDPTKPPTDETVAALAAAISWRRGWRPGIKLALSDTNRLPPGEGADPGDLVFTRRRGRVVWLPRLFDAGRGGHALSCFHRNLTQLSLQVESLSQFVVYAHGLLREWQDLPVRLEECLANALRVLGDLSSGRRTTYRSHSPMRQMKDNDVLEVIEEVRGHFA